MNTKGTAWVIGASSGLGLAAAEAFAKAGWLVVAGARSFPIFSGTAEAGAELSEATGSEGTNTAEAAKNLHQLRLDVTDADSCQAFVQGALAISTRVDVLCYAAGLLVLGAAEETNPEEYRRVMDTNFIGMTRLVAEALPVMRSQGVGKLILFSSINGRVATPFQSAYTASKHAIEGYAKCLAMEGKPFKIQVCVVEPGDHRGGSQTCRLAAKQSELSGGASPYSAEYEQACEVIRRDEANGLLPERLGELVVRNASRRKMRFVLRVAKPDQRAAVWLQTLLWPGLFFAIMRDYYVGKKK